MLHSLKKVADAKEISVPVDIRDDMEVNAYESPYIEGMSDSNALIKQNPSAGWDVNEIKNNNKWRYDWADVSDDYNYLQLDGIEYGMLVKRGRKNLDGQMLATYHADKNLYYEYDIDNGYYSNVNVLGSVPNEYYYNYCKDENNKGKVGIMLVYENDDTEILTQKIYKSTDDKSAERPQIAGNLYEIHGNATGGVGYAHVYEFKADNTKKLDKIRVLGSFADLTDDGTAIDMNNDTKDGLYWGYYSTSTHVGDGTQWKKSYVNAAGETVETNTLGEYLLIKNLGKIPYNDKGELQSSSYKTYGHVFYANILAVTAVTNIENRKADILDVVNSWPENPTSAETNSYKGTLENIEDSLAEFEKAGASVTEITENAKFKAMKKAIIESFVADATKMKFLASEKKIDGSYSVAFGLDINSLYTAASKLIMVTGDKVYETELFGENSIIDWDFGLTTTENEQGEQEVMFAIWIDGIGKDYVTDESGNIEPNFTLYYK